MMLVLTLMNLPDAFDVVAYAAADDANAERKMPNATRHLAGANVVMLMLLPLVVMLVMLVMILCFNTPSRFLKMLISRAKV